MLISFFLEKIHHTLKKKEIWGKKHIFFIYKMIIITIYIFLIFPPGEHGHSDKHHKTTDKY